MNRAVDNDSTAKASPESSVMFGSWPCGSSTCSFSLLSPLSGNLLTAFSPTCPTTRSHGSGVGRMNILLLSWSCMMKPNFAWENTHIAGGSSNYRKGEDCSKAGPCEVLVKLSFTIGVEAQNRNLAKNRGPQALRVLPGVFVTIKHQCRASKDRAFG